MGIPRMGDDVVSPPKVSRFEDIVGDIRKPQRRVALGKRSWLAGGLQLALGFVGGGYFYLEEAKKGIASAALFILGGASVLYLEMTVYPSEYQINDSLMFLHYLAVGIFLCLAVVLYPITVIDCWRIGASSEKLSRGREGIGQKKPKPSPQERFEKMISEHDSP